MNESLQEKQKAEAMKRMRQIGLREDFIRDFETEDKIHICTFQGTFRDLTDEDVVMVQSFEREHNALAYLILRVHTTKGDLDSLLYVGQYTEEWPMHEADLQAGYPLSYTVNHYDPELSEFGCIEIVRTDAGGFIRVG